jgi:hypothetical protein
MLSWKLYVKVLSNRASFFSLLALTSSWRHRKPHCATQIHIVIIPNLLFNKNCNFILHCQKWIVTHLSRVFRCFLSPKRTLGASESQVSREHCKSESRPRSHGGVRVKAGPGPMGVCEWRRQVSREHCKLQKFNWIAWLNLIKISYECIDGLKRS